MEKVLVLKKILIVTEYFYPEEFKINEVALEFTKKGYYVDILTNNPTYPHGEVFRNYKNKLFSKETFQGMTVYRVKTITGYKTNVTKKIIKYLTFMILGSMVSLVIGKKYDYIFGFAGGALTGMLPAVILRQFYKKPVTLWVQDIWPDSVYAFGFKKTKVLEFLLNYFVKYIYRYSSNFAISSKGFENKILTFVNNSKEILYAPNWADYLDKNLESFSFSEEKKIHFTFAGNIGAIQNLDNIIKAFALIDEKHLNKLQLNIIGDGSHLDNLREFVKKKKYKNIIFWGMKPREEINRYLQASDFLIVSLIDKQVFSLTVPAKTQTYISTGKPIIAIINGEVANIIEKNNLGLVCSPNNIDQIKSTFITAIMKSNKEKKTYMKNSAILTKTIFSKNKIINDLLKLLKRG